MPPSQEERRIRRIKIDGLFGQYNYDMTVPGSTSPHDPNVLILYGDNGSGKTTLLRLIYSLLSQPGGGRKTYIAQTPFRRLEVWFENGVSFVAQKFSRSTGTFRQSIHRKGRTLGAFTFKAARDGSVGASSNSSEEKDFVQVIKSVSVDLHYLPDDRKLKSENDDMPPRASHVLYDELMESRTYVEGERPRSTPLEDASKSALEWARKQMIAASRVGEKSAYTIYSTLIRKLAKSGESRAAKSAEAMQLLGDKLTRLAQANEELAKMELTSEINLRSIASALKSGRRHNAAVYQVAKLYADGTEARLKALSEFKALLDNFLRNVNSFFVDKTILFTLKEGFSIRSKTGQALQLGQLSSGEKQLLLLMIDTLASSDQAKIFVIDEPEISLNIKWQRNLLGALLSCLPKRGSQFIIATHSIQILTNFKKYTVELRAKKSSTHLLRHG